MPFSHVEFGRSSGPATHNCGLKVAVKESAPPVESKFLLAGCNVAVQPTRDRVTGIELFPAEVATVIEPE